ncbi:VRR-NUC domain-containing protein [Leminorella grimontii]|uniref:VRR-NUC domain-containing protein n=1 Tax=Leminorella grimontii TaxID=82981 RepID=UPI00321F7833
MAEKKKTGSTHDTGAGKTTTKADASGTAQPVTNPLDLWYLCQKINYALKNPLARADGATVFQRVVTWMIRKENEWFDYHHPYIGECGYDMTSDPPQPIMSRNEPHRPSFCPLSKYHAIKEKYVYRLYGMSTADIRIEIATLLLTLGELERVLGPMMRKTPGPLKEVDSEFGDMFKVTRGLFRIPDVVKLKNIMLTGKAAFEQGNLDDVIEIKFNQSGDKLSPDQKLSYERIAGDKRKFHLLQTNTCQIDDRRQRDWLRDAKKEPMYLPVALGLEKRKQRERLRGEVEEFQHLIGAIDLELDEVRRRLMPVYPEPAQDFSELTQGHRLEAPPSEAEMRRMAKARAGLEMALAGPMWGIGAYGIAAGGLMTTSVGTATTAFVAPAVPVATPSMAAAAEGAAATAEATMALGGGVVPFGNMSRATLEMLTKYAGLAAANSAIYEAAAKEPEPCEIQLALAQDFLTDPLKKEQFYIYWPD